MTAGCNRGGAGANGNSEVEEIDESALGPRPIKGPFDEEPFTGRGDVAHEVGGGLGTVGRVDVDVTHVGRKRGHNVRPLRLRSAGVPCSARTANVCR